MTSRSKHLSLLLCISLSALCHTAPSFFFGGGGGVGLNYVDLKLTEPLTKKRQENINAHVRRKKPRNSPLKILYRCGTGESELRQNSSTESINIFTMDEIPTG
jgi:hypothetical protein